MKMSQDRNKDETINKLSNLSWRRKLNDRNSPPRGNKKKDVVSKPFVKNNQIISKEDCKESDKTSILRPQKNMNAVIEEKIKCKSSLNASAKSFTPNKQNSNRDIKHQHFNQKKNLNISSNDEKENCTDTLNSIRPNTKNNSNLVSKKCEILNRNSNDQKFDSIKLKDSGSKVDDLLHSSHTYRRNFDKNLQQNQQTQNVYKSNTSKCNLNLPEKVFSPQTNSAFNQNDKIETKPVHENRQRPNTPLQRENFVNRIKIPITRNLLSENNDENCRNRSERPKVAPSSAPNYTSEQNPGPIPQRTEMPLTAHSNPVNEFWSPKVKNEDFVAKRVFSNPTFAKEQYRMENRRNDNSNVDRFNRSPMNTDERSNYETKSPEIIYQMNNALIQSNGNFTRTPQNEQFPQTAITKDIASRNPYVSFCNESFKNEGDLNTSYSRNMETTLSNFTIEMQRENKYSPANQLQGMGSSAMPQNYSANHSNTNEFAYSSELQNLHPSMNYQNNNFSSMNIPSENHYQNNPRKFSSVEDLGNFNSPANIQNNVGNISCVEKLGNFSLPQNYPINGHDFSSLLKSENFNASIEVPNEIQHFSSMNQFENFNSIVQRETEAQNFSSMGKLRDFGSTMNDRNSFNFSSANELQNVSQPGNAASNVYDFRSMQNANLGMQSNGGDFSSIKEFEKFNSPLKNHVITSKFSSMEKLGHFNASMEARYKAGDFSSMEHSRNTRNNHVDFSSVNRFESPLNSQLNDYNFATNERSDNFNVGVNYENNGNSFPSANKLENFKTLNNLQNTYNAFSSPNNLGAFNLNDVVENNFVVENTSGDFASLHEMNNFVPSIENENYSLVKTTLGNYSSPNEFNSGICSGDFSSVNSVDNEKEEISSGKDEEVRTFNFNGRIVRIEAKEDNPRTLNGVNSPATCNSNNLSFDKFNCSDENMNQQFTNILKIASVSLNQSEPFDGQMSRQQISNVMQMANLRVNENDENTVKRADTSVISRTIINKGDQSACKITQKSRVNIMKDYHKKRAVNSANNIESDDMHLKYVTLAQQLCQAKNYDANKSAEGTAKSNEAKKNPAAEDNGGHFNVALYKHVQSKRITSRDSRPNSASLNDSSGYETQTPENNFVQQMNARNAAPRNPHQFYAVHKEQKCNDGASSSRCASLDFQNVEESRKSYDLNKNTSDQDCGENATHSQSPRNFSNSEPKRQGSFAVTRPRKNFGSAPSRRLFGNQVQFSNEPNSMTINVVDDSFINFNRKATQGDEKSFLTSKLPAASILKKNTKYFERKLPSSESKIQFCKISVTDNSFDEVCTPMKHDSSYSPKRVSFSPELLEEII